MNYNSEPMWGSGGNGVMCFDKPIEVKPKPEIIIIKFHKQTAADRMTRIRKEITEAYERNETITLNGDVSIVLQTYDGNVIEI